MESEHLYDYFVAYKLLPDGRYVGVMRMLFDLYRVVIGPHPPSGYDDVW